MKIKKYLLFGYVEYEPCGGIRDLLGSYHTIEEVKAAIKDTRWIDDWEIVEHATMELVEEK
jgi:hypothetical protein